MITMTITWSQCCSTDFLPQRGGVKGDASEWLRLTKVPVTVCFFRIINISVFLEV